MTPRSALMLFDPRAGCLRYDFDDLREREWVYTYVRDVLNISSAATASFIVSMTYSEERV